MLCLERMLFVPNSSEVNVSIQHQQAERDAEHAMRRAFIHDILHVLRGEPNELLPFEAVKTLRPRGEHYKGMQTIPLENIIGSVDRYRDFDETFLPKTEHLVDRWVNIKRLKLEGKELPAIQVYKVGETYFVKDGNHRVSVAQAEGQKYIDAEVIELDVAVPPVPGDELKDLIIKGEYAWFLEQTNLETVRPDHYSILFSTPGRYDILLEHIHTRQYYLGEHFQRPVPMEEAVGSWYDRLYQRMVDEIRAMNALRSFPGRLEADLYLWMMDHRYYLTEQYGHDVGSKITVVDFTKHHRPPWHSRFLKRLSTWWNRTTERVRV
jgi:Domain of unknown function (DUF4032)